MEWIYFRCKCKCSRKDINAKDIIFSDGKYISLDLIDAQTGGKSLKDFVTPNLTAKYYDKSKLIAGNHNAKDKIVIFSDPFYARFVWIMYQMWLIM